MSAHLTKLKKTTHPHWTAWFPSQAIQCELRRIDAAYQRFFNKLGGRPHIKRINVASLVVRTIKKTKEIKPVFSLNGTGGKIPIEDQSDLLLNAFYSAVMEAHTPEGYADAFARFQRFSGDDGSGEGDST